MVFVGWRSDALEVLSLMDVLVHPSLSEGFPRVVLEAMALGKAVVATKVGALTSDDIIRDGHDGFLVEPRDPEAIASRVRTNIAERELRQRMGERARQKAFAEYRIQDRVLQLESIWSELVSISS